jgi:hypothetical protein
MYIKIPIYLENPMTENSTVWLKLLVVIKYMSMVRRKGVETVS